MTKKLFWEAITKFVTGLIVTALLLFLPAGTIHYRNGWLLIRILFVPMFLAGIVLMVRNPELLEKRLRAKETEQEQKAVIAWSGIMFLAAFIVAGLNFRFGWIVMPDWAIFLAAGIFLAAYLMYAEVLRENVYLSRTVEVQEHQQVIDTGLYGLVRHPMYSSTLILFLSMGLVLGSPISFAILLLYVPLIAKRIKNEEEVLTQGLEGYEAYRKKVKYKVIPFIW
ncbi:MAG: isoprenylcysteine carboxylmethyltransferase family protein [Clostridia bacterium]|nr:isoprenylcysteine carboxylmethyltransferase family protein [Clostridia bacterium]